MTDYVRNCCVIFIAILFLLSIIQFMEEKNEANELL